jgi:hypothetical protein
MFCGFNGHIDQVSYTGCIPHQYSNFCCNNPFANDEDCLKTQNGVSEACDAEKYGEWMYMRNTKGDVNCRHKSEKLMGGTEQHFKNYKMTVNVDHMICIEPNYWCRDGIHPHFSWSCLVQNSECSQIDVKNNYLVNIVSGAVGIIIILLIIIGILIICKCRRKRKT